MHLWQDEMRTQPSSTATDKIPRCKIPGRNHLSELISSASILALQSSICAGRASEKPDSRCSTGWRRRCYYYRQLVKAMPCKTTQEAAPHAGQGGVGIALRIARRIRDRRVQALLRG